MSNINTNNDNIINYDNTNTTTNTDTTATTVNYSNMSQEDRFLMLETSIANMTSQMLQLTEAFQRIKLLSSPSVSPQGQDTQFPSFSRSPFEQIKAKADDFPIYDGSREIGKDIHAWISQVDRLGTSFGFTNADYFKITLRRFTGQASKTLEASPTTINPNMTWSDLKTTLRQLFSDPNYRGNLYTECFNRPLFPTESLIAYWDHIRYCYEQLALADAEDNKNLTLSRKAFLNSVKGRLPITFVSHVDIMHASSKDKSSFEEFGRILMSNTVAKLRTAGERQELSTFFQNPLFPIYREKIKDELDAMSDRLTPKPIKQFPQSPRFQQLPSNYSRPQFQQYNRNQPIQPNRNQSIQHNRNQPPQQKSVRFATQPPKKVLVAESDNNNRFRCVCGGQHRYCDCTEPSGKAKCNEIRQRLASRPGIHLLAEDNAVYTLEDEQLTEGEETSNINNIDNDNTYSEDEDETGLFGLFHIAEEEPSAKPQTDSVIYLHHLKKPVKSDFGQRPLRCEVLIKDKRFPHTIVDTGAFASVMSLQIVRDLGIEHLIISKELSNVRGMDSSLKPVGVLTLDVVMIAKTNKKIIITIPFIILPTSNNLLIIGMDVLYGHGAQVDLDTAEIRFKTIPKHPIAVTTDSNRVQDRVYTLESKVISPHSVCLLKTSTPRIDSSLALLPANEYTKHNSLYVGASANSLMDTNSSHQFVQLINPTDNPTLVPQYFNLGCAVALDSSSDPDVEDGDDDEEFGVVLEELMSKVKGLSSDQKKAVECLLIDKKELFQYGKKPFGKSLNHSGQIRTREGVNPVNIPPRRMSPLDQKDLKAELLKFEKLGLVEPSNSPWAAPTILVRKENKIRVVVDLRGLNAVTIADEYPLPRMDDILEGVGGKRFFTSLDIAKSFFQVPLNDAADREKTAFRTPFGLYQFKVLPQGFRNSPAIFQRVIDDVLGNLKWEKALVYIDDLLIFSNNFEDHLRDVGAVMDALIKEGLRVQPSKVKLFSSQIDFLGYEVSAEGRTLSEAKTTAIREIETPTNVKQAIHFVSLCGHYRNLIPNFAAISAPLDRFKKDEYRSSKKIKGRVVKFENPRQFDWNTADQTAFDTLKQILISRPVLVSFIPSAKHRLMTDASLIGLAGVLEQLEDDNQWHPVLYLSRKLSPAEQKYSATEIECLAVHYCLSKLEPYLLGKQFTVITDHVALLWLKQLKTNNRRLTRWSMDLTPFYPYMTIVHRPGKTLGNVDSLSRLVAIGQKRSAEDVEVEQSVKRQKSSTGTLTEDSQQNQENVLDAQYQELLSQLPELYEKDPFFSNIFKDLKNPAPRSEWPVQHPHFHLEDNLIYMNNPNNSNHYRICIPEDAKELKTWILEQTHDVPFAGHFGEERTVEKIRRAYFWKGLRTDVRRYCKECVLCQQNKIHTHSTRYALGQLPVPDARFQMISMDFVVGLNKSSKGNTDILVIVDYLTKFIVLIPTPNNLTSEQFADLFHQHYFRRFGIPQRIVSDNDKLLTSRFWKRLAERLGIKHVFATRHHPQTNGQTERFNRTLKEMLRSYCNYTKSNWEELLPNIEMAYNDSVHSVTGETPYYLTHGQHPKLPNLPAIRDIKHKDLAEKIQSVVEEVKDLILINKYQTELAYNKKYSINSNNAFKVGDRLWVKTSHFIPDYLRRSVSKKLLPEYVGPYTVTKVLNYYAYELDFPPSVRINNRINRSYLKLYKEPTIKPQSAIPLPDVIKGHFEYEVEDIIDSKVDDNGVEKFLVRWKGFGAAHDTWEPEKNLANSRELLDAFRASQKPS